MDIESFFAVEFRTKANDCSRGSNQSPAVEEDTDSEDIFKLFQHEDDTGGGGTGSGGTGSGCTGSGGIGSGGIGSGGIGSGGIGSGGYW